MEIFSQLLNLGIANLIAAEQAFNLHDFLHSEEIVAYFGNIWVPLAGGLIGVIFLIKGINEVAALFMVPSGIIYVYYHLLPKLDFTPQGAGKFLVVLIGGAGIAIYFFLIRGD